MVAGLAAGESIVIPDQKFKDAGINVHVGEVTRVDTVAKKVSVSDGEEFHYDKLFLATGAGSFVPPIPGSRLKGVMTLRGLSDANAIKTHIAENTPENIVCIGAGFITMEVASLLAEENPGKFFITVVELMDRPLPLMLDKDMADAVKTYLESKGITVLTGEKVEKIIGENDAVTGVALASGKTIDADMVFMNVGTRPNLELARDMGLEIGRFGIKVNQFQETSLPDVLAGGDCVEKINFITKKPTPGQLRGQAMMQGRTAAKRLAGYDIGFPGVLNAGGCKMFDMAIAATGLTEEAAAREGINTVCAVVESRDKHGMVPGVRPWTLKLIFDKKDQRLIGGQIVGHSVAPAREIDAVSAFILGEKTASDLTTFMSACNPDISCEPSLEPIMLAAEQALQKAKKIQ